jgi:hypothetical protein
MARFIIQSKVYDTDKMQYISCVKKWYELEGTLLKQLFGEGCGITYDCKLYRSGKGNFLLVHEDGSNILGQSITKKEAKKLLMQYDYESYVELFGELEEA